MAKLTMESFNDILINVGGIPKKELLKMEIDMAYGFKIQKMEEMIGLLNAGKDYTQVLQEVNNIDSKLDYLQEQLESEE